MLGPVFLFETKRLFLFIKRHFVLFLVILTILAAFSWEGIDDYKMNLKDKKPFLETEKAKVSRFLNYTQYGTRGFRLLLIPSPMSCIFNDLSIYSGLVANIDTGEGLYIYNTFKGKDLFTNSGGFMDFSGIMLLVVSLFSLFCGYDITRSRKYLDFLSDIAGERNIAPLILISRIVLLSIIIILLSGFFLLWFLINGINAANVFFLLFVLVLILMAAFFVLLGANCGFIKGHSKRLITLLAIYFSFLFLIPWVVQKVVYFEAKKNIESDYALDLKKLGELMDFEKRFNKMHGVWKSGEEATNAVKSTVEDGQKVEYKKIWEYENEMFHNILKRINAYQMISSICPTTFYLSFNVELSGNGFQTFIQFYKHAHNIKYKFIKYYIENKFYKPLTNNGVEPFLKWDEHVVNAKSQIAKNLFLGIAFILFYITILYIRFLIKVKGQKSINTKVLELSIPLEKRIAFVLCENETIKRKIYQYYKQEKNAICLYKVDTSDFRFDLPPLDAVKHFCRLSKTEEKKVLENLGFMDINDLKPVKTLTHELILKIYAAVKIAAVFDYLVVDEFLRQVSRDFETDFFKLLLILEKNGKKIVYLSTEMYNTVGGVSEMIKINKFAIFALPPFQDITLR